MKLRALRLLGIALSSLLLGPVAYAALISLFPSSENAGQPTDALRLLQTFDGTFPQTAPKRLIDPNFHFRQCGYGIDMILGDKALDRKQDRWTPAEGYSDLSAWVSELFLQAVEEARAQQLKKNMSSFELRFLNHCIANTAFSRICGFRVRGALEAGDLYDKFSLPPSSPRPDQSGRERVMCAFLDGIAARKGQKLGALRIDTE